VLRGWRCELGREVVRAPDCWAGILQEAGDHIGAAARRARAATIAPSLIRRPKTLSHTTTSRSCERWWP
jgi:hypothetical protein